MNQIRIVIADDHAFFLDGLRMTLKKISRVRIVGEAADGRVLIERVRETKPDLVITDISMPITDGVQATRVLRTEFPTMGILALSMYDSNNLIVEMMDAGANGYLVKTSGKEELEEAIIFAAALRPYFCSSTSLALSQMIAVQINPYENGRAKLTEKEKQIVRSICEEKSNKEIASSLGLSPRTVESYRVRIQEKTGAKGTAGIVIFGIQSGIYVPPHPRVEE